MTARIYASVLNLPLEKIHYTETIYSNGYSDWLKSIHELSDTYQKVMLVGHNPEMTYFFNYLCNETIDNIPTSGVVGISFKDKSCRLWIMDNYNISV